MRIQKPKPFDPKKEYKIGERCIYNGMVLILKKWIKVDHELGIKYNMPFEMMFRCTSCRIKKDVCTGHHLQCDRFSRSDKKDTFWCFLRVTEGYKKEHVFTYDINGTPNGIRSEAKKILK